MAQSLDPPTSAYYNMDFDLIGIYNKNTAKLNVCVLCKQESEYNLVSKHLLDNQYISMQLSILSKSVRAMVAKMLFLPVFEL